MCIIFVLPSSNVLDLFIWIFLPIIPFLKKTSFTCHGREDVLWAQLHVPAGVVFIRTWPEF